MLIDKLPDNVKTLLKAVMYTMSLVAVVLLIIIMFAMLEVVYGVPYKYSIPVFSFLLIVFILYNALKEWERLKRL